MAEEGLIDEREFDEALAKLEASQSEEIKSVATLLASLRDAVMALQEQIEGGQEDDDEDEEEHDDNDRQDRRR
jgi:hypothetical protein